MWIILFQVTILLLFQAHISWCPQNVWNEVLKKHQLCLLAGNTNSLNSCGINQRGLWFIVCSLQEARRCDTQWHAITAVLPSAAGTHTSALLSIRVSIRVSYHLLYHSRTKQPDKNLHNIHSCNHVMCVMYVKCKYCVCVYLCELKCLRLCICEDWVNIGSLLRGFKEPLMYWTFKSNLI